MILSFLSTTPFDTVATIIPLKKMLKDVRDSFITTKPTPDETQHPLPFAFNPVTYWSSIFYSHQSIE